jgi:hypothetical protein
MLPVSFDFTACVITKRYCILFYPQQLVFKGIFDFFLFLSRFAGLVSGLRQSPALLVQRGIEIEKLKNSFMAYK